MLVNVHCDIRVLLALPSQMVISLEIPVARYDGQRSGMAGGSTPMSPFRRDRPSVTLQGNTSSPMSPTASARSSFGGHGTPSQSAPMLPTVLSQSPSSSMPLVFDTMLDCWSSHGLNGIALAQIAPDKAKLRVSVFSLSSVPFSAHPSLSDSVVLRPSVSEVCLL